MNSAGMPVRVPGATAPCRAGSGLGRRLRVNRILGDLEQRALAEQLRHDLAATRAGRQVADTDRSAHPAPVGREALEEAVAEGVLGVQEQARAPAIGGRVAPRVDRGATDRHATDHHLTEGEAAVIAGHGRFSHASGAAPRPSWGAARDPGAAGWAGSRAPCRPSAAGDGPGPRAPRRRMRIVRRRTGGPSTPTRSRASARPPRLAAPARTWSAGSCGGLDVAGARALRILPDLELDLLAALQPIEVERGRQRAAVEEVVLAVLGRDEAEASLGDDLLDGACGHG